MANTKYKKNARGEYETRIWDGTYNPDGSKHRKYLVSKKSSADLERQVSALKQRVKEGGAVEYSEVSFGEYKQRWLTISKSSREKNTIAMYERILARLAFLDEYRLTDIRHSHLQQAINENAEHPRTCQQIALTFKQIIRMGVRDHLLPRSAIEEITEGISLPRYIRTERRALTPVEKEAILTAELDAKKAAFLAILYYCGLRRGEALALSRFDFDWNKMTLSVTKTLIFSPYPEIKPYPKSKNGIRIVPIPAAAVPRIRPFVEASDGGCLFHVRSGSMMTATGYDRMWRSILVSLNAAAGYNANQKIGKPEKPIQGLTAHILRHNYCTELCYQVPSISTKMIARLLGDTEKMVLEVYSHIVEEKEEVDKTINDAFAV